MKQSKNDLYFIWGFFGMWALVLVGLLCLNGCNPVGHFTDPPKKGKSIVVDCRDKWNNGEPLPPRMRPDTNITCTTGEP